jgi:hypothetical protein
MHHFKTIIMRKILHLFTAVFLFTGCSDYVEIDQVGTNVFKYTQDYRNVMNNNEELEYTYSFPLLSGDDTEITDAARQTSILENWGYAYIWKDKYFSDTQSDGDWDKMYRTIFVCNQVLDGVLASENGTEAEKQKIYGEALVHRSYAYFFLVNMYGKQYDASTADSDLGVPLLLTTSLYSSLKRATVASVYDQITEDLKASIEKLPDLPDFKVRPSKAAAYALLARIYLNKRDFQTAASYADNVLNLQNGLVDLKNYTSSTTSYPGRLNDPEVIFSKLVNSTISVNSNYYFFEPLPVSSKVLTLLGTNDLRYSLFTKPASSFSLAFDGRAYYKQKIVNQGIYTGPTVPEMMLIKAECAARLDNASLAIETLNNLRIKRFETVNYIPYTASSPADALSKVLDERQRELFGRGFRWFDQKRLSKDVDIISTVTRNFKGITYTLEPNSNLYVYPIADKYILLNPELEQNPR